MQNPRRCHYGLCIGSEMPSIDEILALPVLPLLHFKVELRLPRCFTSSTCLHDAAKPATARDGDSDTTMKLDLGLLRQPTSEFQCKFAITRPEDIFAELLLVANENANALPSARDAHIPLLPIGRGLHCGVGEQDVIDRLALRGIGRDGVATDKLAVVSRERPRGLCEMLGLGLSVDLRADRRFEVCIVFPPRSENNPCVLSGT